MKPISSDELSAYLDGELDPQRTQEVRQALASDPALQAEFATLHRLDAKLREAALDAQFVPAVKLPAHMPLPARGIGGLAALVALLVVIRLVPKLFSLPMAEWLIVNAVVIAGLLAGTAWMMRDMRAGDRRDA